MSGPIPEQFSQYQQIAVAVVFNSRGEILISQRHHEVAHGGLWEFPGGKVETGESIEEGLQRELREELGIRATRMRPLIRLPYSDPDNHLFLDVWRVAQFEGEPESCEGQPLRWVGQDGLSQYRFPKANQAIIRALGLADYLLITPDPGAQPAWSAFLDHLKRRLLSGANLQVILRAKTLDPEQYQVLAQQVALLCRAHGTMLQLTAASEIPDVGLHLTSAQLVEAGERAKRPHSNALLSASCHDLSELKRAEALGVDFALLSPVQATRTHPDAVPLGWQKFREYTDQVALPVYALGGMAPVDLEQAHHHGAQGVAAIRALWQSE